MFLQLLLVLVLWKLQALALLLQLRQHVLKPLLLQPQELALLLLLHLPQHLLLPLQQGVLVPGCTCGSTREAPQVRRAIRLQNIAHRPRLGEALPWPGP